MNRDSERYDAFPHPERDPAEEEERLITGSPSHPLEIDHFLFGGRRDWSRPFRALIAGGGTGDGLIQLAQILTAVGRPFEIAYLDPSPAARAVAEARAWARNLSGIAFLTRPLAAVSDLGPFDYIDCGALHRLPDPHAGLGALADALEPDGGIGLAVQAPFGLSGVLALQEAFDAALRDGPQERLRKAKAILERIPDGHPFKSNPNLGDRAVGDTGFYDLLLRGRDRAYRIAEVLDLLDRAGLRMTGSPQAHLYDPLPILEDPTLLHGLDERARMNLAEALRGTVRTHVLYAAKIDSAAAVAAAGPMSVPHLMGVSGRDLAAAAARRGVISIGRDGPEAEVPVPALAANALAQIDGKRSLRDIAAAVRTDWLLLGPIWSALSARLCDYGVLCYSRLLRD